MPPSPFDEMVEQYYLSVVIPLSIVILDRFYSFGSGFPYLVMKMALSTKKSVDFVTVNNHAGNAAIGVPDEKAGPFWALQIAVFVHHATAAAFAFIGWSTGSTGYARIGLALEIGENVLHFAQMAMVFIAPSLKWGPFG